MEALGSQNRPPRGPLPSQLRFWAPGERKLVKLEGRPRWWGGRWGTRAGSVPGPRRGRRLGKSCSGLVPPPRTPARPAQDPRYDVPGAGGVQAEWIAAASGTVSLRERLLLTRPVWLQLRASEAAALRVLRTEPPGVSLPTPGAGG